MISYKMMTSMINSFIIQNGRFVHPMPLLVDIRKSLHVKIIMMDQTKLWSIHLNLPYSDSDQVGHVIVQPRAAQCGKAGKYSNEWQLFEQRDSFGGINSCNHLDFGRFRKYSFLRFECENKAISNHSDINRYLILYTVTKLFPVMC